MEAELLYKKIEGRLTPEETVEVDRWLAESSLHEDYFRRLERYCSGNSEENLPEELLSSIRMEYDEYIERRFIRRQRKRWFVTWMLAACVTFLAGISIWIYNIGKENHMPDPSPSLVSGEKPWHVSEQDTMQYYKEKKSNGKVFLSFNNSSTYNIDEIPEELSGYVDYDDKEGVLTYGRSEEDRKMEMQKIRTAPGADLCVVMEDGTRVWLNSDTEIEFPNIFATDVRSVNIKGEAYFEVMKDSSRPFIVDADDLAIKVYGTQFNVNTRRKGMVATTLVEGSVALQPEGEPAETFLKPGETGEYSVSDHNLEVNDEDIDLYIGWRKGSYQFRDTSLRDLFGEISHWYGIEVVFSDDKVGGESFSGIISRNMPLVDLLNLLTQTNYITYDLSGNRVSIKEKEIN